MEENNSDLKKFLLEIIFENYIIRNDFHNANDMHYYINALKILCNAMEKRIDGDMELICLPKINHMLKSNFSHDQLEKHIQNLLREAGSRVDMQKDEETLFNKNYLLELKKNKLAKIYSHIGDVYSKTERYEEAQQYYQKSIDYYKTLASLFHLELADLYSKLADIAQKLQESPTTISTLLEESVQAMQYKQHIFN
jgi:tetratricopeptide (TPR) repeat protein